MNIPNTSLQSLESLHSKIVEPDTHAAFDLLVQYGTQSRVYVAGPGGHGYIQDFRYEAEGEWPFAFTCNRGHLLFYLRPAGVRDLGATVRELSKWFDEVKSLRDGTELTVRVRTLADAQNVIEHILHPWAKGRKQKGIPDGITRQDVLQAVADIAAERAGKQFGESVKWDVEVDGELYPPKRVLGVAARRATGRELVPDDFVGGEESKCHRILEELGFEIVRKGDLRAARDAAEERVVQAIQQRTDIGPTEKQVLVNARRGQGVYRDNLESIEKACRLTRVTNVRHLRASHIKPWCKSNDFEKLDGYNGLLLSPHVDHLFDQGFISFDDDGAVLVAKTLDPAVVQAWGLQLPRNVGPFRPEQKKYLAWHRKEVFAKKKYGG